MDFIKAVIPWNQRTCMFYQLLYSQCLAEMIRIHWDKVSSQEQFFPHLNRWFLTSLQEHLSFSTCPSVASLSLSSKMPTSQALDWFESNITFKFSTLEMSLSHCSPSSCILLGLPARRLIWILQQYCVLASGWRLFLKA